jgi:hypothetical protein
VSDEEATTGLRVAEQADRAAVGKLGLAEREGVVSNSTHVPKGPGARRPGASVAHAERPWAREPRMAERVYSIRC